MISELVPESLVALQTNDRHALEWEGQCLTYRELEFAVAEVSRRLLATSASGTNVLVMGPLCPAYVVGLLGTLRAGAVPVPVDAGLSEEKLAWLERRVDPSFVISTDVSSAAQYQATKFAPYELLLDAGTGAVLLESSCPQTRLIRKYADRDAGYVIPTSGSTGEPKAVVGSRSGLEGFLSWFEAEFGLGEADRCAALTRVNFDPSLRELLAVLRTGGTVCLPPVDVQFDLPKLAEHVATSGANLLFLVPSLAGRMGSEPVLAESCLPDVRFIFFAGEPLGHRVTEQWSEIAPNAEMVNLYGQTEATLAQLYRRGVRKEITSAIPVGTPRPGVDVRVTNPDESGIGEIEISVVRPALGLLHDSMSALHSIRPFGDTMRTGDLGYWNERRELVVVGRVGNDLKVGGRRVAFQPMIDCLEKSAGISRAVVLDHCGSPQLFVESEADRATLKSAVFSAARASQVTVPELHVRERFPMLRSGKIDSSTLAASLAVGASESERETPVVEKLLRDLSGLESSTAGFVEAGLTSLDLVDVITAVQRHYGVQLTVRECFELRDVSALARLVERRRVKAAPGAARQYSSDEHGDERTSSIPLSSRQLAYMGICMPTGNANWCNLSRELRFGRVVTLTEVEGALATLVERYDALRLVLNHDWSSQSCVRAEELAVPITVREIGLSVNDSEFATYVADERAQLASTLIDPTMAPSVRAVLITGRDGTVVLLCVHHLFVDGLSLDVLARTATELLEGCDSESVGMLDSYRDYCVRTQRFEDTEAQDVEFWRSLLDGAAQTQIPEWPGPTATEGWLLSRPLGMTCIRGVHRLAEEAGVSSFAVLLASFHAATARVFGLEDPAVIVPSQIRDETGITAVGNFTTQLVVRAPVGLGLAAQSARFAEQIAQGEASSAWEFDQRVAEAGLTDTDRFPFSTLLFNQRPVPGCLRARELGAWQPRSLGRSLRYQLQGEVQVSGKEMVMTYYYRHGITYMDPGVVNRVHELIVARIRAEAARL